MMKSVSVSIDGAMILFFHFDENNNIFYLDNIKIADPINKRYLCETKTYKNIISWKYVNYDSIVLETEYSNTMCFNEEHYEFYVNNCINVGNINSDTYMSNRFGCYDFSTIPGKYKYVHFDNSVVVKEDCIITNTITMSAINCIGIYGSWRCAYLFFENKIINVDLCTDIIKKISCIKLDNNFMTHGISSIYIWSKKNHKYLSSTKQKFIENIIINNRYTVYNKIPLCLLTVIINLIIK